MKIGYTEFSFGFAFTENLIRSRRRAPDGAPYFPNLIQEARLGYDVRLEFNGRPIFYQFKLPELMVRQNAKELSDPNLVAGGLTLPFFRMPLMKTTISDQHNTLVRLELQGLGSVQYASPNFQDVRAFNTAFSGCRVHAESILIAPSVIGQINDGDQHHYVYNTGAAAGWFCSEPKKVPYLTGGESVEKLIGDISGGGGVPVTEITEKALGAIREVLPNAERSDVSAIFETQLREARESVERVDVVQDTREELARLIAARNVSRVMLGTEMLLIQAAN
jgi:hypothetical protein